MDLTELRERLQSFAAYHYGASARVEGVELMPGHAGLSFGFDIEDEHDGRRRRDRLVLRIPPKGVRQSGNTDVLRQAPLLRAVRHAGVAVPEVRWWGSDTRWFEVPYLIVERLPGRTLDTWHPDPSFDLSPAGVAALFEQPVRALAQIHALDWRERLAGWEQPRSIESEIRHWEPIIAKSAEPEWVPLGMELRDLLLERQPEAPPIGLFQGDFQPSNFLFDGDRLTAVLDWEISGIGAKLLDPGWLIVFTDRESWHPSYAPFPTAPAADDLVRMYEEATGRKADDVAWYRAFAGYRFGAIDGFNVMLHRRGKRHDPMWEKLAPSVVRLYGRAKEVLLRGA